MYVLVLTRFELLWSKYGAFLILRGRRRRTCVFQKNQWHYWHRCFWRLILWYMSLNSELGTSFWLTPSMCGHPLMGWKNPDREAFCTLSFLLKKCSEHALYSTDVCYNVSWGCPHWFFLYSLNILLVYYLFAFYAFLGYLWLFCLQILVAGHE